MRKIVIISAIATISIFDYVALIFVSAQNAKTIIENKLSNLMEVKNFEIENGDYSLSYKLDGYNIKIDELRIKDLHGQLRFQTSVPTYISYSIFKPKKIKFHFPTKTQVEFVDNEGKIYEVKLNVDESSIGSFSLNKDNSAESRKFTLNLNNPKVTYKDLLAFESAGYNMVITNNIKNESENIYINNVVKDISTNIVAIIYIYVFRLIFDIISYNHIITS